jgi:hypothetical protein
VRKRTPFVVLSVLMVAGFVSAEQMTKEEAQKKADEGKKASCEIVKKQVTAKAAQCPDEAAAVAKINCAEVASYKTTDMMKLNEDCIAKWSGKGAKAGKAEEPKAAAAKDEGAQAASAIKCRAMEGETLVAEAGGDAVPTCYATLKDKVAELKCGALTKKYEYTVQYVRPPKTEWSEGHTNTVYCKK